MGTHNPFPPVPLPPPLKHSDLLSPPRHPSRAPSPDKLLTPEQQLHLINNPTPPTLDRRPLSLRPHPPSLAPKPLHRPRIRILRLGLRQRRNDGAAAPGLRSSVPGGEMARGE